MSKEDQGKVSECKAAVLCSKNNDSRATIHRNPFNAQESESKFDHQNLRFIDVFCGIGGFHVAFERACQELGLRSKAVFASDIDEECRYAYEANFSLAVEGDIKKLPNKEAAGVRDGLIELLSPNKDHLHTITSDNGKEFSLQEKVAERLRCKYYFARPYHSWERGSNENLNGLIRQYFPKKMEFWGITQSTSKRWKKP